MRELAPSCCASYDLARLVDGVQPLHHRRAVDSVLDKCFWLPADVDPANSIPAVQGAVVGDPPTARGAPAVEEHRRFVEWK
jgi:hypothetical protein